MFMVHNIWIPSASRKYCVQNQEPFSESLRGIIGVRAQSLSRVWLFGTPWTVVRQPPLSVGFSRQEYWSGCHFLLQGIFPTQDWTYVSSTSCIAGGFFTTEPLEKPRNWQILQIRTPPPHPVYQHVAGQCEEHALATQEGQIVLCSLTGFVESRELAL